MIAQISIKRHKMHIFIYLDFFFIFYKANMFFKSYQNNVVQLCKVLSFKRSRQCDCSKTKNIPHWIIRSVIKKCIEVPSRFESHNRLNKTALVLSVKRNLSGVIQLSPLDKSLDLPEYYGRALDKELAFGAHRPLLSSAHMRKRRYWAKDLKIGLVESCPLAR